MKAEDIKKIVVEFLNQEESYGDDPQLKLNPATGEMTIVDDDDNEEGFDYWPIMDLVAMSETEPGKWQPDDEAIAAVIEDYTV